MTLPDDWRLCRDISCLDRMGKLPGLRDEISALHWLKGSRTDLSKELEMRSILAAEFSSTELIRMSDHMVLTQIARMVSAGKIHIHRANDPAERAKALPQIPKAASSDRPSRQPRKQVVPDAPFREPPVDLPTFMADIDLPVQAGTLMAAAASGKAFCPE